MEMDQSPTLSAEVKSIWSCTFSPPYAFITRIGTSHSFCCVDTMISVSSMRALSM